MGLAGWLTDQSVGSELFAQARRSSPDRRLCPGRPLPPQVHDGSPADPDRTPFKPRHMESLFGV